MEGWLALHIVLRDAMADPNRSLDTKYHTILVDNSPGVDLLDAYLLRSSMTRTEKLRACMGVLLRRIRALPARPLYGRVPSCNL